MSYSVAISVYSNTGIPVSLYYLSFSPFSDCLDVTCYLCSVFVSLVLPACILSVRWHVWVWIAAVPPVENDTGGGIAHKCQCHAQRAGGR